MSTAWIAPLALGAAAAVNVALWTLRVTLAAGGHRVPASTVAALEAVLFTYAFSHVSQRLDSPTRIIGYAVGVGTGTYLGIVIDRVLSNRRSSSGARWTEHQPPVSCPVEREPSALAPIAVRSYRGSDQPSHLPEKV
jgi:hypothetical protein